MKFFILFALMTVCHSFTFSQNIKFEIIENDSIKIANNTTLATNGILLYEESVLKKFKVTPFTIGPTPVNRQGYSISKLNNTLNIEKSVDLFDGQKKFLANSSQIISFQNHHGIIYQEVLDGEELGNVKFVEINESDLTVKNEILMMDLKKNGIEFSPKKVIKGDLSTFKVYVSQHKKRLMIISRAEYKKGEDEYIYINVFDENLKLVQYRKLTVPVDEICYTTICDDLGNIYGSFKELNENGKIKRSEIDNNPLILRVFKIGETKPITFSIKHDDHSFHFNEMMFSPIQNKVYVLGTYSEGKAENYKGVYHASIDVPSMTLTKMVQTPFSDELIKKYDKDGYASTKENNTGLSRYFSSKYLIRGDGSVDFVLYFNKNERYTSRSSSGSTRLVDNYYGGNILDAHIVDNKVIFSTVGRDMLSPNAFYYNDFSLYSKNENMIVLYNDNENNLSRTPDEKPKNGVVQKSEIVAATIGKNGTVSRQLLLNGYKSKTIGILGYLYPMSDNSFFVPIQRLNAMSMSTKDVKFVKVTID